MFIKLNVNTARLQYDCVKSLKEESEMNESSFKVTENFNEEQPEDVRDLGIRRLGRFL